jgi:hypothetical protein
MIVLLGLFAAAADIGKYAINAQLVDDTHAMGGNTQFHEALFGCNPETVLMQVWQEATAGSVLGVGHVIAALRTLSRDLAYSGHCSKPRKKARYQREGRQFIPETVAGYKADHRRVATQV